MYLCIQIPFNDKDVYKIYISKLKSKLKIKIKINPHINPHKFIIPDYFTINLLEF